MKRTFKELPAFSRLVVSKEISDEQIRRVQVDIMNGGGVVLEGTGGIKKIRCQGTGRGKRGGWRVFFADYDKAGLTFLIWAFPKNKSINLTSSQRKRLRTLKSKIDREVVGV